MNLEKLNQILRVFEIIKQDFSSNTKRKNLFLCTCVVLDPDISLKEVEKKIFLENLLDTEIPAWITVLQTPTFSDYMQFYMTGSVKFTTKKGPGYCYVARSLQSSSFLGHLTGLLFSLYVKIFASAVYALFDC